LPVPTCWASGADSCARAWSIVPGWALRAVRAVGLGNGEVAVTALLCSTIQCIMSTVQCSTSGHSVHARASGCNAKFLYLPARH
jgi:hypothetical protein